MARYLIKTPCYVEDRYFFAAPTQPSVIELKNDTPPSRHWEPLDKAAQAALLKIGVERDLASPLEAEQRKQAVVDDTATMSDLRKAAQGKTVGA